MRRLRPSLPSQKRRRPVLLECMPAVGLSHSEPFNERNFPVSSNRLPVLAAEVKTQHDAVTNAAESAVVHARSAGEKLVEAKSLLKHGEWLPWLQQTGLS